ncbi:vWA domain-containing protein [Streptomyces sp. DR3-1]|uniref:vWA domain-containing protein n=1 Tax=Streptomyces sp. DR3-1 TaxID=2951169 RepID=UPI00204329AD|nr:VWA domain-containing protein [Streptomyces sp. DR3-1]MCM3819491.1 VWA domain-containing protein [Streptomyces sp. DR3-1]
MKARLGRRTAAVLLAGVVGALAAGPPATAEPAPGAGGLVMVLDSSGSMADEAGGGRTRIEAARDAVGTVVDSLPDGYPTGLRVYGADRTSGCTDTRLVRPVEPLDRDAMKKAVAGVEPKGDTPIGLSLRKAVADLPEPEPGAVGRRTVLLISDGEDNCGSRPPCEAAEELAESGLDLRIDAIGFQVEGKAREELTCVAEAGHGAYYDAPDAEALARQLQRAAELSAGGYQFKGEPIEGAASAKGAPTVGPGQYLDSIGPGETRWYAAGLDATGTADFGVTAVPQPGVPVGYSDGLELRVHTSGEFPTVCDSTRATFRQDEGALPVSGAVSRVPTAKANAACDRAGTYHLEVERVSAKGSDQARWPLELRMAVEEPLAAGTVPAQSATEFGEISKDQVPRVDGPAKAVTGGTGFNDAVRIGEGVWKDGLLPAQTRWYKVKAGWGQQLRYTVDFGNEPTVDHDDLVIRRSFVSTSLYAPSRAPVGTGTEFSDYRGYFGKPSVLDHGTVPVTWTNRWEPAAHVKPVRAAGDYYLAISLGPNTATFAENPAVGVVLRVEVAGTELAGPQKDAPAAADTPDEAPAAGAGAEEAPPVKDTAAAEEAGWPSPWVLAAAGGALALLVVAAAALVARRRAGRGAGGPTRGGTA